MAMKTLSRTAMRTCLRMAMQMPAPMAMQTLQTPGDGGQLGELQSLMRQDSVGVAVSHARGAEPSSRKGEPSSSEASDTGIAAWHESVGRCLSRNSYGYDVTKQSHALYI